MEQLPAGPQIVGLTDLIEHRREVAGAVEVTYRAEHGSCIGIGLLKTPEVAVQHARMTRGAVLQLHGHDACTEWLVVCSGIIEVELPDRRDGTVVRYGGTDAVRIYPGEQHRVTAIEEAGIIGVTIPADAGYPEGRHAATETLPGGD